MDLNLLLDHNPRAFFTHVALFVQQLGNQANLNLFLSSLRNEDVTQTLFPNRDDRRNERTLPEYLHNTPAQVPVHSSLITRYSTDQLADLAGNGHVVDASTKVNRACEAVRTVLVQQQPKLLYNPMMLAILTTCVRSTPPQLAEALELIKQLREHERQPQADEHEPLAISSGEALEYVIFLANVDRLFDVALGLYDFELTVMIGQRSHKDPKEYLPFLASLQQLQPPALQRYKIDLHLKRWSSALQHLSELGPEHFTTVLELVQEHHLYQQAIRLYSHNPAQKEHLDTILKVSLNTPRQSSLPLMLRSIRHTAITCAKVATFKRPAWCTLDARTWMLPCVPIVKLAIGEA